MPSRSSIRSGLRRLNLQAYYSAINIRDEYERFKDKVRNASSRWVRAEEVVRFWREHRSTATSR